MLVPNSIWKCRNMLSSRIFEWIQDTNHRIFSQWRWFWFQYCKRYTILVLLCHYTVNFGCHQTWYCIGTSSFSALGTIDGKFDYGYLVSVRVGSEILKGVLYHYRPEPSGVGGAHPHSTALVPYRGGNLHGRRRTRRSKRRRDPNYPKPNRSGYNFFFQEKHNKLKCLYPSREREFTKMIGHSWNNLTSEERLVNHPSFFAMSVVGMMIYINLDFGTYLQVYQKIGLKDKERYKRELKEYRERLTVNQVSASISPTATWPTVTKE